MSEERGDALQRGGRAPTKRAAATSGGTLAAALRPAPISWPSRSPTTTCAYAAAMNGRKSEGSSDREQPGRGATVGPGGGVGRRRVVEDVAEREASEQSPLQEAHDDADRHREARGDRDRSCGAEPSRRGRPRRSAPSASSARVAPRPHHGRGPAECGCGRVPARDLWRRDRRCVRRVVSDGRRRGVCRRVPVRGEPRRACPRARRRHRQARDPARRRAGSRCTASTRRRRCSNGCARSRVASGCCVRVSATWPAIFPTVRSRWCSSRRTPSSACCSVAEQQAAFEADRGSTGRRRPLRASTRSFPTTRRDARPSSRCRRSRSTASILSVSDADIPSQTAWGQFVEIRADGVRLRPWKVRWSTPGRARRDGGRRGPGARRTAFESWEKDPFTRRQRRTTCRSTVAAPRRG